MFISNVTDVPAVCFRRSLLQDVSSYSWLSRRVHDL